MRASKAALLVAAATTAAALMAAAGLLRAGEQTPAGPSIPGYGPGARVLIDAHNAYPSDGKFADRIDRALATGLPVAIEQDLVWFVDPRSGVGRTVVSHDGSDAAIAPTLEDYFFAKVAPIVAKALKDGARADWPIVTLNLDFKTNEPEHHAAVWALLGKYEAWLTTAERTGTPDVPAPLRLGPMLVLTGSDDRQQVSFHDRIAVGQRLRLFGATRQPDVPGANQKERTLNYSSVPLSTLIPGPASNYRRWVNFPWAAVERGGQTAAEEWTPADGERLRALVSRAHAMNLWIRFYTLNGHAPADDQGWTGSYNFGSPEGAAIRLRAAVEAGVDFIATDQYEALARVRRGSRP